ncbi:unnamed protein product, partial [Musa acuminata subsp. burmannicoides]
MTASWLQRYICMFASAKGHEKLSCCCCCCKWLRGGLWHLLPSMERPKGFLRRRDDAATVGKLLGSVTGKFGQAAVSSTAQETWLSAWKK